MMCPLCGAHSLVLQTRTAGLYLQRRRECANHHRFRTYEIYATAFTRSRYRSIGTDKVVLANHARWQRDSDIRRSMGSTKDLVAEYGLTPQTINRIRRNRPGGSPATGEGSTSEKESYRQLAGNRVRKRRGGT